MPCSGEPIRPNRGLYPPSNSIAPPPPLVNTTRLKKRIRRDGNIDRIKEGERETDGTRERKKVKERDRTTEVDGQNEREK